MVRVLVPGLPVTVRLPEPRTLILKAPSGPTAPPAFPVSVSILGAGEPPSTLSKRHGRGLKR